MYLTRQQRSIIAASALVVATVAGLVGFEAGRHHPLQRLRSWFGHGMPVPAGWSRRATVPRARYEGGATVIEGKIYVFGGFHERSIRALARVDVYDPAANAWMRRADMPEVATHRNPVLVGDTVWLVGGFVGDNPGPATTHVWKYDVRGDRWIPGPRLPEPRGGGALLHVGDQLHYVGGYGVDRNTSMGEHWTLDLDAQNAGWHAAPPLPRPRGHFAGVVLDGSLYLVGGTVRHDPVQVDVDWVDRCDTRTGTWSEVASLPNPLSHIESSTFVRDGRIVVSAGRDNAAPESAQDLMFSYDPAANRWMPIGRAPDRRIAPLGLAVGDTLYFGVGADATYLARDSMLWAHSLADPWHRLADMPVAMGEVTATAVGDDLLLIGDGSRFTLRYDTAHDRWDPPATLSLRPESGHHQAGEWLDGKWYVLGGLGNSVVGHLAQIYDPVANRWRLGPDLPWRAGSAATAVIGGTLYAAGGIDGDTTVATAARLDPHRTSWVSIEPMPLPRNHAAAGTDGRRLYLFGGRGPGSGNGNEVANGFAETQIYDPATNRWSVSGRGADAPAPLPQARGGAGKAIYAGGEFWVFGGETRDGAGATRQHVYNRVDIYSPALNRWRAGPPLPTARHGIFPVLIGDRVYVIAGGTESGHSSSTVVEYLDLRAAAAPHD
ncbi:MAG: Kelch repeat-containing protein [Gemmatimonadales bacterium]